MIGAGGVNLTPRFPPRRELGFARGPFPSGLAPQAKIRAPQPLTPARQIYGIPEALGPEETLGDVGTRTTAGGRERIAGADGERTVQVRGAGGVILNLVVGAGLRAVGVPGIVSSLLNFIIGPAIRSAGTTTTETPVDDAGRFAPTAFGELLREHDPWAQATAQARAESAARGVRIAADVPTPEDIQQFVNTVYTFDDTGNDVVLPGSVPSSVPEEQALPSPGLDTERDTPYASGSAPEVSTVGTEFPTELA